MGKRKNENLSEEKVENTNNNFVNKSEKHQSKENKFNQQKSSKKNKKFAQKKFTTNDILEQMNYSFSRDAVWFKKTVEKIEAVKLDLDQKFYNEEKRKQKIAFINKLRDKLKDYKDAIKFAEMYKGIRFFERRKLERMLKQVNKKIADSKNEEEKKKLEEEKEKIVDNINYVKYYPRTYKYLSLLSKKDQDNEVTNKKREKMKMKIKMHLQKILKNKEKLKQANISEVNADYENQAAIQNKNENQLQNDDFFITE